MCKNGIILVVAKSMTSTSKEEKYKQRVKPLIQEIDSDKKIHFIFGNFVKCHETVVKVFFDLDNVSKEESTIKYTQKCLEDNNKGIIPVYFRLTASVETIENCINILAVEDAARLHLQHKVKEGEAA